MQKVLFFLLLALVLSFGAGSTSIAQTPAIKFGPEWTFFSDVTLRDLLNQLTPEAKVAYVNQLDNHFQSVCAKIPKCRFETNRSGYILVLIFEDGFELKIGRDPGVIEVGASPLTLREWRKKAAFVQTHLFDELKKLGYAPHATMGAGHVNIGLEYFKNDLLLLRNFIIDFYNHPGVGWAMNTDDENRRNARFLHQMDERERNFLQKRHTEMNLENPTFPDLVKAFRAITEKYVALGLRETVAVDNPLPYNVHEIGPETRLEDRTLRPQANMQNYILVLEILQARIYHLRKLKKPLVLAPPRQKNEPLQALREWAQFIEEMGLPLERYRPLLTPQWQKIPVSSYSSGGRRVRCSVSVGGL